MINEIKRGNCVLRINRDVMSIVDPSSFSAVINVDTNGDSDLMFSAKIRDTLFTGNTPQQLLENVAAKFNEKPSDEYTEGFYDGVASVDTSSSDQYHKGYEDALNHVINELGRKQYSIKGHKPNVEKLPHKAPTDWNDPWGDNQPVRGSRA